MLFIRMAYRLRWADRPALVRRNGRVHRSGLAPPRPGPPVRPARQPSRTPTLARQAAFAGPAAWWGVFFRVMRRVVRVTAAACTGDVNRDIEAQRHLAEDRRFGG